MKVTFIGLYVSPRTFAKYGYTIPRKLILLDRKTAQTIEVKPPAKKKIMVKIPGVRVSRYYVAMRSYVDGHISGGSWFMPVLRVDRGDELQVTITYEDNGWYKEHR